MIPRSLQHKLDTIIWFIYNHEYDFLNRFLGPDDFTDLLEVSIDSVKIRFVALSHFGQHIGYDCSIEEYNKWFLSFPEEERADFYNRVKRKI